VRWTAVVVRLYESGIPAFAEIGARSVLAGW
jgi:hypothetical protein